MQIHQTKMETYEIITNPNLNSIQVTKWPVCELVFMNAQLSYIKAAPLCLWSSLDTVYYGSNVAITLKQMFSTYSCTISPR